MRRQPHYNLALEAEVAQAQCQCSIRQSKQTKPYLQPKEQATSLSVANHYDQF
jgi:hypothetical protein